MSEQNRRGFPGITVRIVALLLFAIVFDGTCNAVCVCNAASRSEPQQRLSDIIHGRVEGAQVHQGVEESKRFVISVHAMVRLSILRCAVHQGSDLQAREGPTRWLSIRALCSATA